LEQRPKIAEEALAAALPGIPVVAMTYHRREPEEKQRLREAFDSDVRRSFLQYLARSQRDGPRSRGLTEQNLATLSQGRVPRGYQVHHIRPLDNGGTNDFTNLVLIRAHPEHEAVHRYLDPQIHGLAVGQSRQVRLPVPASGIYEAGPDRSAASPVAAARRALLQNQR
jgi:hypothetical protein